MGARYRASPARFPAVPGQPGPPQIRVAGEEFDAMVQIAATDGPGARPGLLDRERIIARPGFNRWLVPPAALAIHLCIGMAYGFSVFWLPLSRGPATVSFMT